MKTTTQIIDAPIGAIFVWHNADFRYPKLIAKEQGREDLKFKSASQFFSQGRYREYGTVPVVIDHHVIESASDDLFLAISDFRQISRFHDSHYALQRTHF